MSPSLLSFKLRPATALLLLFPVCLLQAADPPPASETLPPLSGPRPGTVLNAQPFDFNRPSLSELEKKAPRKPESFERRRPMPMPTPLIMPNQRPRDLLDQEENWPYITPEDVLQDYLMKQILKIPQYGPDGRDLSKYTPAERYYDRMTRARYGMTNSMNYRYDSRFAIFDWQKSPERQLNPNSSEDSDSEESNPMTGFGKTSARLWEMSNSNRNPERNPGRANSFLGLLGLSKKDMFSPDAIRQREEMQEMQERQTEAFKKAMEFPQPSGPALVDPFAAYAPQNPTPRVGWDPFPVSAPHNPVAVVPPPSNPFAYPMAAAPTGPLAPKAPFAPSQADLFAPFAPTKPVKAATRPEFAVPQRLF